MAISKLILNGEVQMDVTSDTVAAGSLLSGKTATKNDGTKVTGTIASKSSSDLTASGATVTAPAGYYANAASKAVSTTTHPNPTAAITSSTGVVTATHTQTAGYVTAGTTTGTLNLTTQGATTYNTSTADQTIASNRWLTGAQTIKGVTTSNLTAANIAEGVIVKVGDANNASRITQITGTHSGATSYTATISGNGNSSYCYVTYNGTKYYTDGGTFTFKAGDTLTIYNRGNDFKLNDQTLVLSNYSYTYTLPVGDVIIYLWYESSTINGGQICTSIIPTGEYQVSRSGGHIVYNYAMANVPVGSAFPPAVTITKAPTIGVNTSGVVTASYNGSSSITPTVTSGYVSQGTAGTISTTGTSTYQLTSKAAATYYPSTADQTIASQRWLVGNQTIKSVTTSNLTAANIAEGVVVKVGDSSNASRITQVTGTHKGSGLTCTMTGGSSGTRGVFLGGEPYYTSFTFNAGDTLRVFVNGSSDWDAYLYINNELILGPQTSTISYNITPNVDFSIQFTSGNHRSCAYITIPEIDITENGQYEVGGYGYANVDISGSGGDISTVSVTVTTSLSDIIVGPIYDEENSLNGNTLFTGSWSATGLSFSVLYNENFNIDEGGGYFYYGNRIQYISSANRTITPTNNIQLDNTSTIGNCKIYNLLIMGDNASFTVT